MSTNHFGDAVQHHWILIVFKIHTHGRVLFLDLDARSMRDFMLEIHQTIHL